MLSQQLQDAINEQINHEFSSAYAYLAMSAYFERMTYPGFAQWTRMQAQEEVEHAMKLFDYVNDRGGTVSLDAVACPTGDFESPAQVFEKVLAQEQHVTQLIHKLYSFAKQENDYATQVALEWFIAEQVEEEKTASEIVEQLRRIDNDKTGLLIMDRELGQRQSAEASAGEG